MPSPLGGSGRSTIALALACLLLVSSTAGANPLPSASHLLDSAPSTAVDVVLATIAVGANPGTPLVDPYNGNVFVPNYAPNTVSVISPNSTSVSSTLSVGTRPTPGTFDPANGDAYFPNAASNNVSVVQGNESRVVAPVPVGAEPTALVWDPANGDIYVAAENGGDLTVIQGSDNSVVGTIAFRGFPTTPLLGPEGTPLFVPTYMGSTGNLSVLAAGASHVEANVTMSLIISGGVAIGTTLYVTCWNVSGPSPGYLIGISAQTDRVVSDVPIGPWPSAPLYDPSTDALYFTTTNTTISAYFAGNLTAYSLATDSVQFIARAGFAPGEPVLDPRSGALLVSDRTTGAGQGRIAFFNASSGGVDGTVPVGYLPSDPTFDPVDGRIYVANFGNATVSVLGAPQPASVTGLWGLSPTSTAVLLVVVAAAVAGLVLFAVKRGRDRDHPRPPAT